MTIEELQKFMDDQDAYFRTHRAGDFSDREHVFARTIKLGEEYGELCDEVLASINGQRQEKIVSREAAHLEDEFADVLITTFMLAKAMKVDVMGVLDHKVQKIRERNAKQK